MGDVRERRKRETRQRISDIATDLFFERGFDAVTVDEIADAANVSKMTVFNYFPRKEDLFLDRQDDVQRLLREAVAQRPDGQSPIDALRLLVDRLRREEHPFARVDAQTAGWWRVVAQSPTLQARVREIGDEAVGALAVALGGPKPDGVTRLEAGMVVLAWRTAYSEALRVFERGGSARKAGNELVRVLDRGFDALRQLRVT